jgi:H+/Cl- antiporter ClcA
VILAGIVAIALVGDYTYFGQPQVIAHASSITPKVLLIAALCGLGGGIFSRLTLASVNRLPWGLQRLRMERPALFAGLCGLGVAVLGAASGALTYGTGYDEARSILENHTHLSWVYAPARAAATLLSYLSGIPAGLLAPSLSVGAGFGQFLADHLGQTSAVPFAILGMCGFLAGVTQAPLTSFVIVMEMTAQHAMVLPLMITAAIATAVSRLVSRPLYQSLADRYAPAPRTS